MKSDRAACLQLDCMGRARFYGLKMNLELDSKVNITRERLRRYKAVVAPLREGSMSYKKSFEFQLFTTESHNRQLNVSH